MLRCFSTEFTTRPATPWERKDVQLRPVPVARLRLLSFALCLDGAPVYDAAGCALTARCLLAQPYPFPFSTA